MRHFRYVDHDDVPRYEKLGWVAHPSLRGTAHGIYSTLMEWTGEGEPAEPEKRIEAHAE